VWQLVLAVERSAEQVLQWSNWRRWHQAWARWHHHRKRGREAPLAQRQNEEQKGNEQPQVEEEEAWRRLEEWLASRRRIGRPYSYERRAVFDAIVYVMQTDCGWQALPSQYPPWKAVYEQYRHWRKAGIWEAIWAEPTQCFSNDELQL
jgi:hypothetical protein